MNHPKEPKHDHPQGDPDVATQPPTSYNIAYGCEIGVFVPVGSIEIDGTILINIPTGVKTKKGAKVKARRIYHDK